MTMISAAEAATQPIVTDAEIRHRVAALIGHARRRSLWLLFTDSDDIQSKVLIPIEDYPTTPQDDEAAALTGMVQALMGDLGAAGVILVWERCADERLTPADRAWARAMAHACREHEVRLRGQLISHRSGVCLIEPEAIG